MILPCITPQKMTYWHSIGSTVDTPCSAPACTWDCPPFLPSVVTVSQALLSCCRITETRALRNLGIIACPKTKDPIPQICNERWVEREQKGQFLWLLERNEMYLLWHALLTAQSHYSDLTIAPRYSTFSPCPSISVFPLCFPSPSLTPPPQFWDFECLR